MPGLISLKTDLKDLKYDSMPLGSDAPYVTKDINKPPSSNGTSMQITKRVDDLTRIGKMLTHKPGIKYLANEALLQQEDLGKKIAQARGKGIKALATTVLQQAGKTLIGTSKILASTLAQVPVNGTGTHFVKGFRTDTFINRANTSTGLSQFFGTQEAHGAPLALQGKPIPTGVRGLKETTPEPGTIPGSITNQTTGTITTEDSSRQSIYSGSKTYTGTTTENNIRTITNPASGANIYKSRIFVNSGSISNLPEDSIVTIADYLENFNKGDQATINENAVQYPVDLATFNKDSGSFVNQSTYKKDLKIIDFRTGSLSTYSFDYSAPKIKKETRVNLGDQGAASKSAKSYTVVDPTGIDKINQLDIKKKRPGDSDKDTIQDGRDLIKFYFEIITPDKSPRFLYFRAFLDSFDDNYSANWDARKYVGRAESFYTYGGFDRSINFSFKIAAATRAEMKPLYKKMVYLASSTAPTYQQNGGFMRGTLAKMTIGDYLVSMPGVIESVKYSWNTEYPWEIAMQEPEGKADKDMQELPMIMDCSISFKPIHTFAPQTDLKHFFTSPETSKFF